MQPLDTVSRNVTALLNRSHSTPGDQRESAAASASSLRDVSAPSMVDFYRVLRSVENLAQQALEQIKASASQWELVAERIPNGEYHK